MTSTQKRAIGPSVSVQVASSHSPSLGSGAHIPAPSAPAPRAISTRNSIPDPAKAPSACGSGDSGIRYVPSPSEIVIGIEPFVRLY